MLSKTEQKLLITLMRNKNMVLGRETLMEKVWGNDGDFVDENALSVSIKGCGTSWRRIPGTPLYSDGLWDRIPLPGRLRRNGMSFLLNSPYITYILGAFLIITVILLIFSVYLILYVIREYKKLEQMIDSAIDGNFQEESFDEQRLSRLQNKMYQFISSSFLGRKKVEEDKEK